VGKSKACRRLFFINLAILLCSCLNISAQYSEPPANVSSLESSFVKPMVYQKLGELCFNVVRIYNPTDSVIRIKPILNIPDDWALFGSSFIDTLVQPNQSISLSFSLRVSSDASSDIQHQIDFNAYSDNNRLLSTSSFLVQLEAMHKWDVIMPDKRVFFYPDLNEARFEMKIVNMGNVAEVISIDIQPDKKISLKSMNGWEFKQDIRLAAHQDTIIEFKATYNYSDDRIFDIGKVQIYASAGDETIYRNILIEKYSDIYSPFNIDRTLQHETELGMRGFTKSERPYPFIKARGAMDFSEESNFRYNFTYYDLTETEDVIGNTYYHFLYSRKSLKAGIGAFSSQLGRNLYSRNSVMVSNALSLSPASTLEGYISYSFLSPKTSAAIGYGYQKEDVNMLGSVSYDLDDVRKVNTGSVVYRLNSLSLTKDHLINAVLYGYTEDHYLTKKYTLAGIAWDINYYGDIGKRLSLQFTNNYGSPDIPGNQMGLLNFLVKLKYLPDNEKRYFSTKYFNISRDYYNISITGDKLPNILLKDQYANILYHTDANSIHRWSLGPSAEFYQKVNPTSNPENQIAFDITKFRLEYRGYIGRSLMISMKSGLSYFHYIDPVDYKTDKFDFHLLSDYHKNGYGIRLAYNYGPMVNTGLYQYALDAITNGINISPYAIKSFLSGRIALTFFTNYTYRFDMEYGSINVNPKIEAYVFRNWYFVTSGTYNYTHQQYKEQQVGNSSYYVEFSIKKKWGKSHEYQSGKELIRLKVYAFQDDNGNGKKDKGEAGIPYIKIRAQLTNVADQRVMQSLPYDFTLLTNEDGMVIFNGMPKGFYDLLISPLSELKEYFFVSQSAEKLELSQKSTYYVPFQKASKITGQIVVKRRKFLKEEEQGMDIANVRVSAFNKQGESFSDLTDENGRFTIFAPGNNTYYLRMKNVFGNKFKILKNDIPVTLSDSISEPAVFNVVELDRQLKLKKAKPAVAGTSKPSSQKLKVLSGDLYEKTGDKGADKDAAPDFNIKTAPVLDQQMIPGKFYVVVAEVVSRLEALRYNVIMKEQGINTYVGVTNNPEKFYVFTNHYQKRAEAKSEVSLMTKVGLKTIWVIEYKE